MVTNRTEFGSVARILEISSELFAQRGYIDTSIREIAKLAVVNQTTIFRQFKAGKKAGLFGATVDFLAKRAKFGDELHLAFHECEVEDPRTIKAIFLAWRKAIKREWRFASVLWCVQFERSTDPEFEYAATAAYSAYLAPTMLYMKLFCEACASAGTLSGDPRMNCFALRSLLFVMIWPEAGRSDPYCNPLENDAAEAEALSLLDLWLKTTCQQELLPRSDS